MYDDLLKRYIFKLVKRAIKILTIMPQTMMSAAVVPKSFKASGWIASLLGTIPCTPNACWNILPNGSRDRTTTSAPALKIKNLISF